MSSCVISAPYDALSIHKAIGLAPELLLGRYAVSPPQDKTSRLAIHEQKLGDEMKGILASARDGHRGELANQLLLPRSLPYVEAIGHRMAWEAAKDAGVASPGVPGMRDRNWCRAV